MVTNLLLAYFVVSTTALVIYLLWRTEGEKTLLRAERDAYRKLLLTVSSLPTSPFEEYARVVRGKQQPVAPETPDEPEREITAQEWKANLGNLDSQAYAQFERDIHDELYQTDPEEVFKLYQQRYGQQAPYAAMALTG